MRQDDDYWIYANRVLPREDTMDRPNYTSVLYVIFFAAGMLVGAVLTFAVRL